MPSLRSLCVTLALTSLAVVPSLLSACSSSNGNGNESHDGGTQPPANDAGGTTPDATTTGDGSTPTDAGAKTDGSNTSDDAGWVQANHAPFPTIVYGGAPLLLKPKIVTVTFAGDPFTSQLVAFGTTATSKTNWWPTVMSEYCQGDGGPCVGDGPAGIAVQIDASAPSGISDNALGPEDAGGEDAGVDIQTYLQGLMASGAIPLPDSNTIYAVYFPGSLQFGLTGDACQQFEGYHSEGIYNGQTYTYAINVECLGTLDDVTVTAAHEFAETASDGLSADLPDGGFTSGYTLNFYDLNAWPWLDDLDSEIADMCDDYLGLGQDHWTEGSYVYQRIWSQKAAAANENPCRPVPAGEVYFNAAPTQSFFELNVGETTTIEVDGFSDGPHTDWTVLPEDWTDPTGQTTYTNLAFAGPAVDAGGLPATTANNGSKLQLSITLTQDPTNTANGAAQIILWSYAGSTDISKATAGHYWPIDVVTRAAAEDAGLTWLDGGVPMKPGRHGSPHAKDRSRAAHRSYFGRNLK